MSARLVIDEAQILRFSGPGPRYTSYPTVPVWTEAVGEEEAGAALERAARASAEALSLYVHLPFCARLCLFCGCTVEITRRADRVERYLAALEREIELVARRLGARTRVAQLHLGGGTPTHLSVAELRRLHAALARHFEFLPQAEISIEVHPHVTSCEQVDLLTELGFARFSMGVQDTDPRVQAVIQRDQTLEETARLVAHCRARGVASVNLDLMYGLPEQTEATFERTLADVAAIRPERLALYGYAHVPWLKPFQKALEGFALPSDSLVRALHSGRLQRNFQGYTDQRAPEMIAFGMSAIGDVGGAFVQNARETKSYEERITAGRLATVKGLVRSPEDDLRRAAIQALMCQMRLDLDALGERFGRGDLAAHFAAEWRALEPLEAEGLCRLEPRSVEVLPTGRLFLRHLAMVFDAYLTPQAAATPRFSQTV